jgi:hypothetical protein
MKWQKQVFYEKITRFVDKSEDLLINRGYEWWFTLKY